MAVRHLDELARVTGMSYAGVAELLDRYRGARGIPRAHTASRLMDGSASGDETRLRLILVDGGLPRPQTRIVLGEGLDTAVIGMGWDGPKVGVSRYDGSRRDGFVAVQHTQLQDVVQRSGWIEIQVADLNRSSSILYRARDALRRRGPRV